MLSASRACVSFAALFLVVTAQACAQSQPAPTFDPCALVPSPMRLERGAGDFHLTQRVAILRRMDSIAAKDAAALLAEYLGVAIGAAPSLVDAAADVTVAKDKMILITTTDADTALGEQGYTLDVEPSQIVLRATGAAGFFSGVQTIRQLVPATPLRVVRPDVRVPAVRIVDVPRYAHRGFLLDCGRHFMPVEFVKRYIDLIAAHKLNVLHWHLTEDQGWRIEIRAFARLTQVGARRKATRDSEQPRDADGRYGGYYTQDQVREIVAFAAARGVTIIPEIEMPGHSLAALSAYPELSCGGGPFEVATTWGVFDDIYCAGNEKTFEFLERVLDEVIELFPSPFIHIGGDEAPKTRWKQCPRCQARIKGEGLKDENELQSYFVRRIERHLASRGRRLVGWDEILDGGIAEGATVQSWRGLSGAIAAAARGHDVISSPTSHCYLDYAQEKLPGEPTMMGFLPLETVYAFEPTPKELSAENSRRILGLEANMWTEHAPASRVDWQVFPRLCALAEVGWSPANMRDLTEFQARMRSHYRRLDAWNVNYYIPAPRPHSAEREFAQSIQLAFEAPALEGEIRYTRDGSEPTAQSERYDAPLRFTETTRVKARLFLRTGRGGATCEIELRKT
ncbi:MAG: family 20 glycosylhydrolase [Phycisphaerae bacterium]